MGYRFINDNLTAEQRKFIASLSDAEYEQLMKEIDPSKVDTTATPSQVEADIKSWAEKTKMIDAILNNISGFPSNK